MIISINNVEDVLSHMNITSDLLDSQNNLLKNIATHEDQITALAYRSIEPGAYDNDLSSLVLAVMHNEKQANEDLISAVSQINDQLELVNRVRICYEMTRLIYPLGYRIVFDQVQMGYSYDYIQSAHRVSRGNITTYKNREYRLILILHCMFTPNCNLLDSWNQRYAALYAKNPRITIVDVITSPEMILDKNEIGKAVFL